MVNYNTFALYRTASRYDQDLAVNANGITNETIAFIDEDKTIRTQGKVFGGASISNEQLIEIINNFDQEAIENLIEKIVENNSFSEIITKVLDSEDFTRKVVEILNAKIYDLDIYVDNVSKSGDMSIKIEMHNWDKWWNVNLATGDVSEGGSGTKRPNKDNLPDGGEEDPQQVEGDYVTSISYNASTGVLTVYYKKTTSRQFDLKTSLADLIADGLFNNNTFKRNLLNYIKSYIKAGSTDGQILKWNNTDKTWEPAANPLVDGTVEGQILRWDGQKWDKYLLTLKDFVKGTKNGQIIKWSTLDGGKWMVGDPDGGLPVGTANNQILRWNNASDKKSWEPQSLTLKSIVEGTANNQILKWNNSAEVKNWQLGTVVLKDMLAGNNQKPFIKWDADSLNWTNYALTKDDVKGILSISDLKDVNIDGVTAGNVLKAVAVGNGFAWVASPSAEGVENLVDLGDVNINGQGDGYVLKYNASSRKWEAQKDQINKVTALSYNPSTYTLSLTQDSLIQLIPGADLSSLASQYSAGNGININNQKSISVKWADMPAEYKGKTYTAGDYITIDSDNVIAVDANAIPKNTYIAGNGILISNNIISVDWTKLPPGDDPTSPDDPQNPINPVSSYVFNSDDFNVVNSEVSIKWGSIKTDISTLKNDVTYIQEHPYELPVASNTVLGGIKTGRSIHISDDGTRKEYPVMVDADTQQAYVNVPWVEYIPSTDIPENIQQALDEQSQRIQDADNKAQAVADRFNAIVEADFQQQVDNAKEAIQNAQDDLNTLRQFVNDHVADEQFTEQFDKLTAGYLNIYQYLGYADGEFNGPAFLSEYTKTVDLKGETGLINSEVGQLINSIKSQLDTAMILDDGDREVWSRISDFALNYYDSNSGKFTTVTGSELLAVSEAATTQVAAAVDEMSSQIDALGNVYVTKTDAVQWTDFGEVTEGEDLVAKRANFAKNVLSAGPNGPEWQNVVASAIGNLIDYTALSTTNSTFALFTSQFKGDINRGVNAAIDASKDDVPQPLVGIFGEKWSSSDEDSLAKYINGQIYLMVRGQKGTDIDSESVRAAINLLVQDGISYVDIIGKEITIGQNGKIKYGTDEWIDAEYPENDKESVVTIGGLLQGMRANISQLIADRIDAGEIRTSLANVTEQLNAYKTETINMRRQVDNFNDSITQFEASLDNFATKDDISGYSEIETKANSALTKANQLEENYANVEADIRAGFIEGDYIKSDLLNSDAIRSVILDSDYIKSHVITTDYIKAQVGDFTTLTADVANIKNYVLENAQGNIFRLHYATSDGMNSVMDPFGFQWYDTWLEEAFSTAAAKAINASLERIGNRRTNDTPYYQWSSWRIQEPTNGAGTLGYDEYTKNYISARAITDSPDIILHSEVGENINICETNIGSRGISITSSHDGMNASNYINLLTENSANTYPYIYVKGYGRTNDSSGNRVEIAPDLITINDQPVATQQWVTDQHYGTSGGNMTFVSASSSELKFKVGTTDYTFAPSGGAGGGISQSYADGHYFPLRAITSDDIDFGNTAWWRYSIGAAADSDVVKSVKINGTTYTPNNGIVDLGTIHSGGGFTESEINDIIGNYLYNNGYTSGGNSGNVTIIDDINRYSDKDSSDSYTVSPMAVYDYAQPKGNYVTQSYLDGYVLKGDLSEEIYENTTVSASFDNDNRKLTIIVNGASDTTIIPASENNSSTGLTESQVRYVIEGYGYITGITSQMITDALGYTPALSSISDVSWSDISDKPSWIGSNKPSYSATEISNSVYNMTVDGNTLSWYQTGKSGQQTYTPSVGNGGLSGVKVGNTTFNVSNNTASISASDLWSAIEGDDKIAAYVQDFKMLSENNVTATLSSGTKIATIGGTSIYAPAGGSSSWSEITGKPSFATVATSGSYSDLSNRPSIPTEYSSSNTSGYLTKSVADNLYAAKGSSSSVTVSLTLTSGNEIAKINGTSIYAPAIVSDIAHNYNSTTSAASVAGVYQYAQPKGDYISLANNKYSNTNAEFDVKKVSADEIYADNLYVAPENFYVSTSKSLDQYVAENASGGVSSVTKSGNTTNIQDSDVNIKASSDAVIIAGDRGESLIDVSDSGAITMLAESQVNFSTSEGAEIDLSSNEISMTTGDVPLYINNNGIIIGNKSKSAIEIGSNSGDITIWSNGVGYPMGISNGTISFEQF